MLISGAGVSAATAAHLLVRDGFAVVGSAQARPRSAPVVMLSAAALGLLRDIFDQPDLLAHHVRVARRIVAWGGAEPVVMPHEGIVVSGVDLAAAIAMPALATPDAPSVFTLDATLRPGTLRRFGRREAVAAAVDLAPDSDAHTCYVEATESGWLFLIPCGEDKAWLLGVGGTIDALLGQSRLVAPQVRVVGPVTARFETAPRMLETLAGDDWLACGTAAIAFDPICGDGTAQAAREAVLAAAVVAGIRDGGDPVALLGHYHAMLLAAMRRHLQISLPFYCSGGTSPWWHEQASRAAEGYAWCTAQLARLPEPRFALRGVRLVPHARAA